MKTRFYIFFFLFCFFSFSANSKVSSKDYLNKVVRIVEQGNYSLGSRELYRLSRLKAYKSKRTQIRYTLGIAFLEMKLYHLASLQFIHVIKNARGKYKTKSMEKLSDILGYFEDDQLFCPLSSYIRYIPSSARDSLNFYFGKCFLSKKQFSRANRYFKKVKPQSSLYGKALYYNALSYAEQNQVKKSVASFKKLISISEGVTDTNRIAALMGLARVLYQGKKFEDSIKFYRSIPRDTKYFYDSLLETSWNFLQAGKFRSALSNFQTLHSVFYKDRYQPESLILRAYVYLYICKYYEMEKILNLFDTIYAPVLKDVKRTLRQKGGYNSYLRAILSSQRDQSKGLELSDEAIPEVIKDRLKKSPQFTALINYLKRLRDEKLLVDSLPVSWRRDRVGRNAVYVLNRRIALTKKKAGQEIKRVLLEVYQELKRLSSSEQYLRYDMLKGKREYLKKKIAKKYLDKMTIDEKISRNYYIQNGYEYWPFDAEVWLDELGNYHYLGKQNCE